MVFLCSLLNYLSSSLSRNSLIFVRFSSGMFHLFDPMFSSMCSMVGDLAVIHFNSSRNVSRGLVSGYYSPVYGWLQRCG